MMTSIITTVFFTCNKGQLNKTMRTDNICKTYEIYLEKKEKCKIDNHEMMRKAWHFVSHIHDYNLSVSDLSFKKTCTTYGLLSKLQVFQNLQSRNFDIMVTEVNKYTDKKRNFPYV